MEKAPSPGGQLVCGMQEMHSVLEQWNPSLHWQVVRDVLLVWTAALKFLSVKRKQILVGGCTEANYKLNI